MQISKASLAPIPFQPRPLITQVGHLEADGVVVSAITRRWERGDARRCRLCPPGACCVYKDSCTILVPREVRAEEAPMFAWHDSPVFGETIPSGSA